MVKVIPKDGAAPAALNSHKSQTVCSLLWGTFNPLLQMTFAGHKCCHFRGICGNVPARTADDTFQTEHASSLALLRRVKSREEGKRLTAPSGCC